MPEEPKTSEAEITARVRNEQKEKYRGRILELEGKIEGLKSENATLIGRIKSQNAETEKLKESVTAMERRSASLTKDLETANTAGNPQDSAVLARIDALAAELQDTKAQLTTTNTELQTTRMSLYAKEKILKFKDDGGEGLIEEMVFGGTPEEVDAAILRASTAYSRVVERLGSNKPPLEASVEAVPDNVVDVPAIPTGTSESDTVDSGMRSEQELMTKFLSADAQSRVKMLTEHPELLVINAGTEQHRFGN